MIIAFVINILTYLVIIGFTHLFLKHFLKKKKATININKKMKKKY